MCLAAARHVTLSHRQRHHRVHCRSTSPRPNCHVSALYRRKTSSRAASPLHQTNSPSLESPSRRCRLTRSPPSCLISECLTSSHCRRRQWLSTSTASWRRFMRCSTCESWPRRRSKSCVLGWPSRARSNLSFTIPTFHDIDASMIPRMVWSSSLAMVGVYRCLVIVFP